MNKVSYIFTSVVYSTKEQRIHFLIKTGFIASALAFFTLLCIFLHRIQEKPAVTVKYKHTYAKPTKFIYQWNVPNYDSIALTELINILKGREGFCDTVYHDKKGNAYIGYGHLLKRNIYRINRSYNESKYNSAITIDNRRYKYPISIIVADSLLCDDIQKAYIEYSRIHQKQMKKEVYNIFISGKPALKKKHCDTIGWSSCIMPDSSSIHFAQWYNSKFDTSKFVIIPNNLQPLLRYSTIKTTLEYKMDSLKYKIN